MYRLTNITQCTAVPPTQFNVSGNVSPKCEEVAGLQDPKSFFHSSRCVDLNTGIGEPKSFGITS